MNQENNIYTLLAFVFFQKSMYLCSLVIFIKKTAMQLNENILANLASILTFLGIVLGTAIVAYLFKRIFNRLIAKNSALMKTNPTNYKFLGHSIVAIIYVIGMSWAVYETNALRTVATSLLAGAGILAVAVGFASQQALSNIVSGIMIVIFKPFRVNDRLNIRTVFNGIVEDITLRHTVIRDFENKRIIVPNMVISQEILINADFDDPQICRFVEIPFPFDENIEKAKQMIIDEIAAHPEYIDQRTEEQKAEGMPIVAVRAVKLLEYGVMLRAYAWAADNAKAFVLACDVLESLVTKFNKEGIKIAYPQRNVTFNQEEIISALKKEVLNPDQINNRPGDNEA